ncbi:MAG: glutathione S-transferase C-terminal domain-containing protein, partial [Solirubrobacteraceae bacterium]
MTASAVAVTARSLELTAASSPPPWSKRSSNLTPRLADRRFLFGDQPLETDWRLFTTLVRFDAVYQIHFKCSVRKLVEYLNLWPYDRDLYRWPGVADTVAFDEIRAHYYRTYPRINPAPGGRDAGRGLGAAGRVGLTSRGEGPRGLGLRLGTVGQDPEAADRTPSVSARRDLSLQRDSGLGSHPVKVPGVRPELSISGSR